MLGGADITCSAERILLARRFWCLPDPGFFFFIFMPFVASPRHRPAGPGVSGLGPGLRVGMQCRAKPEAEGELSLYSLWVRPPWPPACCTAAPETGKHHAQWLSDCFIGMFLPPPPMGRHAGRARAVGVLVAERLRIPCPPAEPGKQSGRHVGVRWAMHSCICPCVM